MVPIRFDLIVRSASNHAADSDDELDKDRDRGQTLLSGSMVLTISPMIP